MTIVPWRGHQGEATKEGPPRRGIQGGAAKEGLLSCFWVQLLNRFGACLPPFLLLQLIGLQSTVSWLPSPVPYPLSPVSRLLSPRALSFCSNELIKCDDDDGGASTASKTSARDHLL